MSWNSQHWRGRQKRGPTAKAQRKSRAELRSQVDEWHYAVSHQWHYARRVTIRAARYSDYADEEMLRWICGRPPVPCLGDTLDFYTWARLYVMGERG